MTKPFLTLLFTFCIFSACLHANTNDSITVRHTAEQWFETHSSQQGGKQQRVTAIDRSPITLKVHPRGWLCQKGKQFVLLSKDEATPTVLGYGSTSPKGAIPTALQSILNTQSIHQKSKDYPIAGAKWQATAPLLTTQHGAESPYNDLCPYYTDDKGNVSTNRCLAGCVAIAMEQVLTYYRRTYTLQDTLHGWTTDHYSVADVLPGQSVDTRLILDNYKTEAGTSEQRTAVAQLMYYLGMAAHMNWGLNASGTNTYRLIEPLQRAFGLKHVAYLDSYQYNPVDYWNYIAANIMAARPVYYAGANLDTGGHAFVLDGLDDDGLFHVCWGSDGDYDGFFRLDVLYPHEPVYNRHDVVDTGYFCNQEALVVCPDEVTDVALPDSLHRTGLEIAIDSLWLVDSPTNTCNTRMGIALRNTSSQPLTTTFAFLLNAPTDTATFKQADWLAFTGCTLMPGERDTLYVRPVMSHIGPHTLSVTADGEHILRSIDIDIVPNNGSMWVAYDTPQLSINEEEGTATITHHITNPSTTQRASTYFLSELVDDETGTDVKKIHNIFLSAAADTTFHVTFRQLKAEHSYTFNWCYGWNNVVYSTSFSLPATSGIEGVKLTNTNETFDAQYFTLDGRPLGTKRPTLSGVYILREANKSRKIIIP